MMLHEICIYNNKIFLILDTYLIAYSYRKNCKLENERFHECSRIKIPVKDKDIRDIRFKVIDNYVTGLKSLIILAFDCKGLNSAFIFCDAFRKKIYRIVLPDWSVAIEDYSCNVFVSDGPTFLVHSNNTFHFYSVPFSKNSSFDYQFICSGNKDYKILQFQSFRPFYRNLSQGILSLLITSCHYSNRNSIKFIGFISEKNKSVIKCEQLHLHSFFPRCYESVLKAVQVTNVVLHFKASSLSVENIERINSVSVICTRTDCLVFTNAVLTYCCKLTLSLLDVMCMRAEFSDTFLDNRNLVLVFENMIVFFITITKKINCEVVKHWTDNEVSIMGDVLKKGSKQILLIKQFNIDTWQNDCILYDMLSFIPIDLLCRNSMPDDCLKITVTGLEKKIQVGLAAVKETEREISEKSTATIDALIKLNELRINNEYLRCSNNFQESLVNLILSKDENKAESAPVEYEPHVKLLNENQTFLNNQWIISLLFINDGERTICNPSIKVVIKNNEVACIQKLFIYSSDTSFLCNEFSRQINPKNKFSIILCFDFSIIHGDEEILKILTWYNGSEDEFSNEIFLTEEKKVLIQYQVCLLSKVSLISVLNCKMKRDISSPADLLFARASQQRISLSVSSLHSNISEFEEMLMKNSFDALDLHLLESSSGKYIIFNNEKSLLFGIHLSLKNSSENRIEIEVFAKNEKEMCLLIHYLYQHLPEDVIISPCLKYKDEFSQLKRTVATSMKNEIDLLLSSLNIHNISEELRQNYPKLMSSQTAGTISIPKATYQRIRTALIKKECITDTVFKCIS